jgi:hypothetical protein
MAFTVRKTPDTLLFTLVAAWNARQVASVASFFHYDITQITTDTDYMNPTVANDVVATANASSLATSVALVNSIKRVVNRHFADARAHKVANTLITTADATDLATGITLGNAIKAAYNTHIASTTYHSTADSTNATAATDASDQSTLNTLLNEIKADLNAHVISAPVGAQLNVVDA